MNFPFRDIQRDNYIVESMHNIDSNQVKYPSARDAKWARDGSSLIHFFFYQH